VLQEYFVYLMFGFMNTSFPDMSSG